MYNPASGRCVDMEGSTGQRLREEYPKASYAELQALCMRNLNGNCALRGSPGTKMSSAHHQWKNHHVPPVDSDEDCSYDVIIETYRHHREEPNFKTALDAMETEEQQDTFANTYNINKKCKKQLMQVRAMTKRTDWS